MAVTTLKIPTRALVLLVGPSGMGKSTFARRHFRPTEILSSDHFRALVTDDENDQSASREAFDLLHMLAAMRLARGRLTVVDATNVQPAARKSLLALARRHHAVPVAIVFDLPEPVAQQRNRQRPGRQVPPEVVRQQLADLHRSLPALRREGVRLIYVLHSPAEVDAVEGIVREPAPTERGRFRTPEPGVTLPGHRAGAEACAPSAHGLAETTGTELGPAEPPL